MTIYFFPYPCDITLDILYPYDMLFRAHVTEGDNLNIFPYLCDIPFLHFLPHVTPDIIVLPAVTLGDDEIFIFHTPVT